MPDNIPYLDKYLFGDRFKKHLERVVEERKLSRLKVAHDECDTIVEDLANSGPAWTGASAGRADRGSVDLVDVPNHPANRLGLEIGNEPGQSGWQVHETARTKGTTVKVYISNPMYNEYLKYQDLGIGPHANPENVGFVRNAFLRHLNRRQRGS